MVRISSLTSSGVATCKLIESFDPSQKFKNARFGLKKLILWYYRLQMAWFTHSNMEHDTNFPYTQIHHNPQQRACIPTIGFQNSDIA